MGKSSLRAKPLPAVGLCLAATAVQAGSVLVEAESFENLGGWVVDQQFMEQMGSPFLLAHGLGKPVADAMTPVQFPAPGKYRVFVRTRDWVAPWNAPGAPGRFQLSVDGAVLEKEFGTEGAEWHWQDGGAVQIAGTQAVLALHDLTGFGGRCDAIFFTAAAGAAPPNAGAELAALRRRMLGLPEQPQDGGSFDLIVVGGGIAGTCAALSAARLGLTVALVQDRPVLGGNNSSEVRVWLGGDTNKSPYPRIGDVVKELDQKVRAHYGPANTGEIYEDDRKLALVKAEKKITLFLNYRVNEAETEAHRIKAVLAQETTSARRVRLAGRWFADCTGDGTVGFLAGADYEMTEKGRMGAGNLWSVRDTGEPSAFPRCPWALDLSDKPFPGRKEGDIRSLGGWYWESGFDYNPFEKGEYIRDWNFRAMYGAWDCLKNVDRKFPTYKLNWSAYIMGPRESRRLLGDMCLSKDDLLQSRAYPDGCVPTSWDMDLHLPDKRYEKGFEGDAFISLDYHTPYPRPYWIPYRCLYSRNVANLFMAGRDISVTHEALGSARVMRTGGMMGELVGMAAAVCKQQQADPRGVYGEHLDKLKELMRRGVGKSAPE